MAEACLACQVNQGMLVPPGGVIYRDDLWQVDHRLEPCPVLGWLIAKPLRHVVFFDELSIRRVRIFDFDGPSLPRVEVERVAAELRGYLQSGEVAEQNQISSRPQTAAD
ncbi:hypothetical protein [Alicyclobacillus mali (ex Roth et al. 2021)]|uniref:hypothetical protein n=1 Tax=Alicyclobacillus mali (ex Roth et al. 2021) TaxID=1123961 RepID=UPI0018D369BD|nr:hypothetical protein [Alicyclobacillus mali (ex Roth et al. 2021)]